MPRSCQPATRRALFGALAMALLAPLPVAADTYPARPVRMIVPFAPGGATDVVARALAERMSREIGQPIVVENRAGAGGVVGTDAIAKAKPDGYTIGVATASTHEYAPVCNPSIPYHPIRDFTMIGMISTSNSLVYAKGGSSAGDLKAILAASSKDPGSTTWGTPGVCSNTHFLIELVNTSARSKVGAVHYRGNSAATTDLMSGTITLASDITSPSIIGFVKAGTIKPLALTAKTSIPELKGVPTYQELGIDLGSFTIWQGLLAPPGTPKPAIDRLNAALRAALAAPDLVQRWQVDGIEPFPDNSPEAMSAHIDKSFLAAQKLVKELGDAFRQ